MTLMKIFIVLFTVVNLGSSKNGMVTVEVNIPSILNQLLDINKSLNMLRASVGYSGKGSLENSVELVSNNEVGKTDDTVVQRGKDVATNSSDVNLIKVQVKGLEDVTTALTAMRRASQLKNDYTYEVTKDDFVKQKKPIEVSPRVASVLKKLRLINRKRNELIMNFNLKFPGLFDAPSMRRAHELRPWVEMAPGTIKTEIVTYPPNHLASRLKHLLKLKKKQDEESKS